MRKLAVIIPTFALVFSLFTSISSACAGCVATGDCVKDDRSLFWKNRHRTGLEGNKVYFYSGTNYSHFGIGQGINSGFDRHCYMGMNEVGLAIGSFAVYSTLPVEYRDIISDATVWDTSPTIAGALGNFSTVLDAANWIAHNGKVWDIGTQYGIISSEEGVGAVVGIWNSSGTYYSNIAWVNNSYAALANSWYCTGQHDSDNNDITIQEMLDDIVNNGTSLEGGNDITVRDLCQRGGKNVSGMEKGAGTFNCSGEISKSNCVSGFVVISGNNSFDGALSMAWLALGRQPLVGVWLPLGASYLDSSGDIPSNFTSGDGIEDYVDVKVTYATDGIGQGTDICNCSRVREIQGYTNYNENRSFVSYDYLMDSIMECNKSEAIERLERFADNLTSITL
ncbi:MAG: hypothetical protein ACTSPB_17110, partial [Candidatus Thorarchaeota archaeon]